MITRATPLKLQAFGGHNTLTMDPNFDTSVTVAVTHRTIDTVATLSIELGRDDVNAMRAELDRIATVNGW